MNARTIILLTISITFSKSKAQSDSSTTIYNFSGRVAHTSIWTERGSLQQFTRQHPWMVELDFGAVKNTQHAWNYCNCYSQNGLSLGYINFASPAKLGRAITFAGFAEPYLLINKHFQLSLRGSAGLAFLNKLYDSLHNKDNIFFSTKMNFILRLGINFAWRLNENWKLTTAAEFNHISNGGRKDPNEGMNFPGVSVGVNYALHQQKLERRTKERFVNRSISVAVHGFGNIRTAWADANWPEERRLVIGTNIGVIKRLGRIMGIGVGGEYYYDGINEVYQNRSNQIISTTVAGLSIQNYLFFGKLLFGQQLAIYITPNTGFQKNLFQRYILEYEVMPNWFAGVTLKAHGDHSDYLAFSTGYFLHAKSKPLKASRHQ